MLPVDVEGTNELETESSLAPTEVQPVSNFFPRYQNLLLLSPQSRAQALSTHIQSPIHYDIVCPSTFLLIKSNTSFYP
ncbi:hypothetical protein G7K_0123-t1 [Saitoella complicata NRRL Y-17804]|uniref:Uncharacterized protein n=1 Tax=Saitoella complicata (strain BCRC 22490 / CBS 7301 / JCM 7358 / NBRC 10748 / NRRL Y-17804) TaxID=698492 RepID=A0A0E9N7J7_SAICN|nr:hypothetical protein G7K_0123-t1 [Saitoella complicata NRRL Y-17804]